MVYFPFHILKWEFSHFWVYCHHISHLCYWILIWGSAEEKHGTEGKKYVVPFYISQLMWGDQNAYSAFRQKKSSGMDNKLNVVWNTVFQQGQNWGDSVFFGKVIHFLVEFSFFFCALLYVRYCEYSGVHWADSREEAPSHAACSAVGTLCQPHCCLHTGRERSCHQVGAHRIMINAANSHFTAFIFA